MKTQLRNVRLDVGGRGDRRGLEKVLISNRVVNHVLGAAARWFLTALVWPRFVAPYRWELTRHTVVMKGLGRAFEGYTILQLTDLHAGKTRQGYLEEVIEGCLGARGEAVDLVVITGDLIDYHPRSLPLVKELLGRVVRLAKERGVKDGVVAIFGNHDYHEYSWRHVGKRSARRSVHRRLVKIVEESGIRLLRNEAVQIERGADRLTVVGMDEMWTGLADGERAFKGISEGEAVICLQHNPDGVEELKRYPWQLMLCGHSHGGQANFPVIGPLYVPMEHREYLRGFFEMGGGRRMFVSRGIGHSTPIRLRCPPEVSVFTLRSKR